MIWPPRALRMPRRNLRCTTLARPTPHCTLRPGPLSFTTLAFLSLSLHHHPNVPTRASEAPRAHPVPAARPACPLSFPCTHSRLRHSRHPLRPPAVLTHIGTLSAMAVHASSSIADGALLPQTPTPVAANPRSSTMSSHLRLSRIIYHLLSFIV